MEKKERFRCNLAEGMAKYGLTEQQLADELGMDRYWRKWLRRLLKDGLERPNAKSHDMLERLAERLGFGSAGRIWLGYADANTAVVEEFKELLAAAGWDMRRDIKRQIIHWQRIRVAERLAREKFSWDYLSSEGKLAFVQLTGRVTVGVFGQAVDVEEDDARMSKVILDIITAKDLFPYSPISEIWQGIRPELVRMVQEKSQEFHNKFPAQRHCIACVPE